MVAAAIPGSPNEHVFLAIYAYTRCTIIATHKVLVASDARVEDLKFAADDSLLAVSSEDGRVTVYTTGTCVSSWDY
jgi:hypothetical protein